MRKHIENQTLISPLANISPVVKSVNCCATMIGIAIGTTISISDIKSSMKPAMNAINNSMNMVSQLVSSKAANHC